MALFKPKDHIPLGEAVARLGRDLYPNDWAGDEFLPTFATMAGIASDTDAYLIGWVARRCDTKDEANKKPRKTKAKKTRRKGARRKGPLLSVATTERWNRATEVYRIAQGMLDGIVFEWPRDFPLGPDDLDALEAERAAFHAPRLAAHNRALKAIQRMRWELYGTPPDRKDAIPALRCSPDKPPALIDCESWFGPDGLNRLRHAVQDDCGEQGSSRIVVPLERVDAICPLPESEKGKQPDGRDLSIKAETACRRWLVGLMGNDRKPDKAKPEYEKAAKEKFKIGAKAFVRAWAGAIEETGNTNWSRPGRKS